MHVDDGKLLSWQIKNRFALNHPFLTLLIRMQPDER